MEGMSRPRSKDPYEPDGKGYGNPLENLRAEDEDGVLVLFAEESDPDKNRRVAFDLRTGVDGMREIMTTCCAGVLARLQFFQGELRPVGSDLLRRKGATARV